MNKKLTNTRTQRFSLRLFSPLLFPPSLSFSSLSSSLLFAFRVAHTNCTPPGRAEVRRVAWCCCVCVFGWEGEMGDGCDCLAPTCTHARTHACPCVWGHDMGSGERKETARSQARWLCKRQKHAHDQERTKTRFCEHGGVNSFAYFFFGSCFCVNPSPCGACAFLSSPGAAARSTSILFQGEVCVQVPVVGYRGKSSSGSQRHKPGRGNPGYTHTAHTHTRTQVHTQHTHTSTHSTNTQVHTQHTIHNTLNTQHALKHTLADLHLGSSSVPAISALEHLQRSQPLPQRQKQQTPIVCSFFTTHRSAG